jgi:hypothetical protein
VIQVVAFSAIIIPCGPIVWCAICVIRAGGLDAFLHSIAEWEEFSYKWPAACMLSTIAAVAVSLKIVFAERRSHAASSARRGHGYWAATRILVPGLVIVGVAYAIEAVCGLWLGAVLGFIFVCYLIVLWVIRGQSERHQL